MKKISLFLILILSLSFVSAVVLGTFKQNDDVQLTQSASGATTCNITSVRYPNSSIAVSDVQMTKDGTEYNYTLLRNYTLNLGSYFVLGVCGNATDEIVWGYDFIITRTGESSNSSQAIITMGIIGVMFLFFGLGRAFKKEKWKLKITFDILALLMAVVAVNSFRIIVSESSNLGTLSMGALVAVIAILLFMVGYFLVLITLEIINYFKNKENLRWSVDQSAY